MKIKSVVVCSLFIMFGLLAFVQTDAYARKRILPGRGDGVATVKVTASSLEEVARAVTQVFGSDGYNLKEEGHGQLRFSRSSGRMKDFSYGGLAGGGTYEQVIVYIHENGGSNYRIECNVYMTEGDSNPDSMDTEVLRMFGREYQRMLRRVKRKLN